MLNESPMESTIWQSSSRVTRRLGVLGGTFDPIHMGHLAIAECAAHELDLPSVLFIPAKAQPQKLHRQMAPPEHRLAMVELAVEGNPRFAVSRCEIDRDAPSYTIDTLRILRTDGQGENPCELHFICGSDSLLDMHNWYRPDQILSQAVVAVARRPGYDDDGALRSAADELMRRYGGVIRFFDAPRLDISSTELRERLAAGLPVRYLIPEPVRIYISKHSLYREEIRQSC